MQPLQVLGPVLAQFAHGSIHAHQVLHGALDFLIQALPEKQIAQGGGQQGAATAIVLFAIVEKAVAQLGRGGQLHEAVFEAFELLDFLGDFISQHRDANTLYRDHLCAILIARVHDEFGHAGLCNVMSQMDLKANWVSDIIFEASDFDNALFKRHGTYDDEIVEKARNTKAMIELNKKIWRLRRRYSNIIVDEVMENKKVTEVKED